MPLEQDFLYAPETSSPVVCTHTPLQDIVVADTVDVRLNEAATSAIAFARAALGGGAKVSRAGACAQDCPRGRGADRSAGKIVS